MAGLDTNVLLRWLVRDDEAQAGYADALFESALASGENLFVPITVVLELEWVLRSRYDLARNEFTQTLTRLLTTRELDVQSVQTVEQTLRSFQESNVDFADCLHSEVCAVEGHAPLLTFDARAARLADVRLVDG